MRRALPILAIAFAVGLTAGTGTGGAAPSAACARVAAVVTDPPVPPAPQPPTIGPIDPKCMKGADSDLDGWYDFEDNCATYSNPDQADLDNDSGPVPYPPESVHPRDPTTGGDVCDTDEDNDGVPDIKDDCPRLANPDQKDRDGDGIGDGCDPQPDMASAASSITAPLRVRVDLPSRARLDEIRAGVMVTVRCSTGCSIQARMTVDRGTARRLGLRRVATIASGSGGLTGAGRTFVFVHVGRAVLKRIARVGGAAATVVLTVSDSTGHRVASRHVLRLVPPA